MIIDIRKFILRLPVGAASLIYGFSLTPGAAGQHEYWTRTNYHQYNIYNNCDKYCFASCSRYNGLGSSEFTACVHANLYCSCVTKISYKNPFFLLILGLLIIAIALCMMCCRWVSWKGNGRRSRPTGSGAHIIANSSVSRSSQTSPRNSLTILLDGSEDQKLDDLPPEYVPPPAYNNCILDVDPPPEVPEPEPDSEEV